MRQVGELGEEGGEGGETGRILEDEVFGGRDRGSEIGSVPLLISKKDSLHIFHYPAYIGYMRRTRRQWVVNLSLYASTSIRSHPGDQLQT